MSAEEGDGPPGVADPVMEDWARQHSQFNLFIDPLADEIEAAVGGTFENALNLFADDIILMSPSATSMQHLLSICESFAALNGLAWGLSKCHALLSADAPEVSLLLDGSKLRYVKSAEYFGVDVDASGVTDAATFERICKAGARLRQLKAAGISRPRLGRARLQRVYGVLLRPVWTYAIHLAPFSNRVERLAADLLSQVVDWIFPRLARYSKRRAQRLLALEDADVRRSLQLLSMRGRMENALLQAQASDDEKEIAATSHDAEMATWWVNNAGTLMQPTEEQFHRWEEVESSRQRVRRVATGDKLELHSLFRLPTTRHVTCAANWPFGRFPEDREAVRWFLGSAVYDELDERLRTIFAQSEWEEEDQRAVTEALERMSDFWPYPLRHRRLLQEQERLRQAILAEAAQESAVCNEGNSSGG